MCTVTIVPLAPTSRSSDPAKAPWRMACNRDESHGRAAAHPPQRRVLGQVQAIMPIDPAFDGTWIGVNQYGLALTLLNYNLPEPPTGRDRSRGSVIPALLAAATIAQLKHRAAEIERDRMMPFRLVAFDGLHVMLWRSTEPIEQADIAPWHGRPIMFTSSGLGDHLVEAPRRALFDQWFDHQPETYDRQQLAFHQHRWPNREHFSVCMRRDDARTVSYTTIAVDPHAESIDLFYFPDGPERDTPVSRQSLALRRAQP